MNLALALWVGVSSLWLMKGLPKRCVPVHGIQPKLEDEQLHGAGVRCVKAYPFHYRTLDYERVGPFRRNRFVHIVTQPDELKNVLT